MNISASNRRENRHEPQPSPSPAAGGHLDDVPPRATVSSFRGHNLGQRVNDVYCVEMAARLTGTGVTINVLMPGFVDTGLRLRRQFRSQYVLFAVSEVLTRHLREQGLQAEVIQTRFEGELDTGGELPEEVTA